MCSKFKLTLFSMFMLLLFAYPFLFLPFWADQAIFAYIGSIINHGSMPYVDAWDLKPPIIYYLYAFGLKVFGQSMFGIRMFDFFYILSTMFAVFKLAGLLFCSRATGFLSALLMGILYFLTNDFATLSQSESFMILPILRSVYFSGRGTKKNSCSFIFMSGVFIGIVFMTKTTGALIAVPAGIYVLYGMRENPDMKNLKPALWFRALFLPAGFASFMLIFLYLFYKGGALDELLYTLFVYDSAHFKAALGMDRDYSHIRFAGFVRRYFFVLLPSFVPFSIKGTRKNVLEYLLLYSWIFITVLAFILQARFYPYQLLPLIAPAAIAGAAGLLCLWTDPWWNSKILDIKKKFYFAVVIVFFMIAAMKPHIISTCCFTGQYLSGESDKQLNDRFFRFEPLGFSLNTTREVAAYLKQHTSRDETVFIWGFQPLVYFLAERRAPSRFFFNAPLVAAFNERKEEWQKEFMNDMESGPPEYILVAEHDPLQNSLMCGRDMDSMSLLKEFPGFLSFIKKRYILEVKIDNIYIFRLTKGRGTKGLGINNCQR